MNELIRTEVLAGHFGHCDDYKLASGLGQTMQPFTWLSQTRQTEDVEKLSDELREFKRTREAILFEAREFKERQWKVTLSGKVNVIYTEIDTHGSRVRALLQWAPDVTSKQPASRHHW